MKHGMSIIGYYAKTALLDEDGNQVQEAVSIPGYLVIVTKKLKGLDSYISTETPPINFAGATTILYAFTDEVEAKEKLNFKDEGDGESYSPEFEDTVEVPASITMRQAKLALLEAGLLDSVEAAISAMEESKRKRVTSIEWEYATLVERDWQTLKDVAALIGLTESQVDQLFIAASKL